MESGLCLVTTVTNFLSLVTQTWPEVLTLETLHVL